MKLKHLSAEITLARKKPVLDSEFILFNVLYEDGRRTSNRKVPSANLSGADGDEPARSFLEAQDNKIAEMSGNPRGMIKSITRS
ncbi:ATP-dependent DNA ligase family profile domain-containing protein [uncultured Gammaproteobacteria bacterium]